MDDVRRIALVFDYGLAYCRDILHGIKRFAQSRPNWVFAPLAPSPATHRTLASLKPAGIIAHLYSDPLAERLRTMRIPLVNVCGVLDRADIPRVGLDDHAVGSLAAAHLLDRGLRRFAFVGHPDHAYSVARERGFVRSLQASGFSAACYHDRRRTGFDPQGRPWSADASLVRWVRSLPRPVGLFACNDLWGLQVSEVCRQAQIRVPDEVAILGVDNDDLLCDLARPSLSSVRVPAERIGYGAATLVAGLIAGGKPPVAPLLLGPEGVAARQSSDVLAIDDPQVVHLARALRNTAAGPVSIPRILGELAVSRRSIERRFRKALGRGIWEEARRVQIEHAKSLLADSDLPIARVAERAGFSDGKHLSVAFRQQTGTTPSAYRRTTRTRG